MARPLLRDRLPLHPRHGAADHLLISTWRGGAALAVGAIAATYLGVVVASRSAPLRRTVASYVSRASGYDVTIASLALDWSFGAHATGVSVGPSRDDGEGDPAAPFLTVAAIVADGLLGAATGQGAVAVVVQAPRFQFDAWAPPRHAENEAGRATVSLPAWIRAIELRDGVIEGNASGRAVSVGPFDLTASSLEAGDDLKLAGRSLLPGDDAALDWSARIVPASSRLTAAAHVTNAHLADLLEAFDVALPDALAEGTGSMEVEIGGVLGAPLAAKAAGSVRLDPEFPELLLDGAGEVDLTGGRCSFALTAATQEPEHAIPVASSEVRFSKLTLEKGELDLAKRRVRARVHLPDVGWKSSDDAVVVQKLGLGGEAALEWTAAPTLRLDLRGEAGEVLLASRYYLDLAANPIAFAGAVRRTADGLSLGDGRVSSPRLGRADVTASSSASKVAADVRFELPDVAPVFALAVRDPWQEAFPTLGGVSIGGRLEARARIARADAGADTSVDGRIEWKRGTLDVPSSSLQIGQIALDLPVLLGPIAKRREEQGSAKLDRLTMGGVAIGAIDLPLVAARDRLALARPAPIAALDGQVLLEELAASDLTSDARALVLGLRAYDLRLAPIATAFGLPAFGGTISASLPHARLGAGELATEGEISARVFGGSVRFDRLRASDLGSGVATLAMDASFDEISLAALTDVLEIGRMSGVIRGAVKDLMIQAGAPVRFQAWLETVERSGVPQRISVAAIRSLSIVGGSGGDPFSSGVLSFFDEYGYAKIGFRSTLEGDRLTLEGIEQRDGKDLLVVGSRLPPRVDVVSHTRIIAFSEMVRRLERAIKSDGPRIE